MTWRSLPNARRVALGAALFFAACVPGAHAPKVEPRGTLEARSSLGGERDTGPFRVVFAAPRGQTDQPTEVSVAFNRPMRPLAAQDAGPPPPVTITPMPKGTWEWLGSRAARFSAEEPLLRATSYVVKIPAGTRALDGETLAEPYEFTFATERPKLVRSSPYSGERGIVPTTPIDLDFDQPVSDAEIARAVKIRVAKGGDVAFDVKRTGHPEEARLVPRTPLPLDATVHVAIDASLRGTEGPLPAGAPGEVTFSTYGPLVVDGVRCGGDSRECTPGSWMGIDVSNPVKASDLRRAIEITPPVKLRWSAWQRSDEPTSSLDLDGDFKAGARYTIRVRATLPGGGKLVDKYGQALAQDWVHELRMGDLPPRVALGVEGTYLEPTQLRDVPLFSTNVDRIEVGMAPMAPEETGDLANEGAIESAAFGSPRAKTHTFGAGAGKNQLARRAIRLEEALGANGRGPVAIAVRWQEGTESRSFARLVDVTDVGISAKATPTGDSVVWATRLSTGKPIEGAAVEIHLDGEKQAPQTFRTDASGIAVLPIGTIPRDPDHRPDGTIVVRDGNDVAVRRLSAEVDLWRRGVSFCLGCSPSVGLLFTDRGLYRPGERVSLKGVVRVPEGRGLTTPAGKHVKLTVTGPESEKIATIDDTLSQFGTFAQGVTIPAAGKVGRYEATAQLEGSSGASWSTSFQIAEYRPAEFKVGVEIDRTSYVRGDSMKCVGRGDYLFGAPMSGADVRTSITRSEAWFAPEGSEGFSVSDATWTSAHRDATPRAGEIENASGKLDEKGATQVSAKLDMPAQHGPERVTCEAEVTDLSRQSFASDASAIVHPAEFYVAVRAGDDVFVKSGDTIHPRALAIDPNGKKRVGVPIRLALYKRTWTIAKEATGGARIHTETTPVDTEVGACDVTSSERPASCDLRVTSPGYFVLRATSKDARGNPIAASEGVYALGESPAAIGWGESDDGNLPLVANKASYEPGETARVLVKSPWPTAEALVTVEREGVITERRVSLAGATPTIEVPITDALMPNAYVSVLAVRGRTKAAPNEDAKPDVGAPAYRLGFVPLVVNHESRRLAVSVQPKQRELRPGATADVEVEVKDAGGKAAKAEVTLYAADEGALLLAGYKTPDPVAVFFAPRELGVESIEARDDLARIQRRAHGFSGIDKGLDGGDGGGAAPRRDFRQTAFFASSLVTDDRGRVHASFKLPDSLTTFRVMAVAVAADDRFGAGEAQVTTSKPLMVRPALPRVLRAGDELEASAIVTSKGMDRTKVDVSIAVEGLRLAGEAKKTIDVASGSSVEVRFPMTAPRAGAAKFTIAAVSSTGTRDSVEVTRQIVTPTVIESAAVYGETTTAAGEKLGDLGSIRDDVGGLDVALSPTALAGLGGGVEQLVEYPYGCTEQLTSRLVPLLPLRDLAKDFGLALPADVDAVVEKTVAKVTANQHADGGFGLWAESKESSPWLTAYALWGLGEAKRRGVYVRPATLDAATRYLESSLEKVPEWGWQWTADAFAVDVLAENGAPDPGAASRLFAARATLGASAKAQLLHAMAIGGGASEAIDELVRQVESTIHLDGPNAFVADGETGYREVLDSDTRTTALALRGLLAARPKHPMASKLAMGLLAARRGGTWRTTQETAWALLALDAYRRAQEAEPPNFDARVYLGSSLLYETRFEGRGVLSQSTSIPSASLLRAGGEVLAFEEKGQGKLFYQARLRFARKEMPKTPVESGFFLSRASRVVTPESIATATSEPMKGLSTELGAGDLVLVDLAVVAPSPRDFVVLEDPLPAGLEAIDTALLHNASWLNLGASQAEREGSEDVPRWWRPDPLTRTEVRDDRVVFFADHLPAGVYHYRYLARATSIGRFVDPPAKVEEMYVPETYGRTAGAVVTIAAR